MRISVKSLAIRASGRSYLIRALLLVRSHGVSRIHRTVSRTYTYTASEGGVDYLDVPVDHSLLGVLRR